MIDGGCGYNGNDDDDDDDGNREEGDDDDDDYDEFQKDESYDFLKPSPPSNECIH